ncbi:YesL family protein [Carnobacterium gallinarum]|uniref:YesL family protein n=1 Tax=Carnobacterium gallinarum TaxID=2749 RepID=UPI000554A021|nr:DUF624 domain-containing protein [Carnobacterium gallinarum]
MTTKLYQFSCFYLNLIALNFLWLIGCLLGGILFGIAPASVSLFSIYKEQDLSLFQSPLVLSKAFFQNYYREFKQANLLSGMISLLGLFLWFDYQLVITQRDIFSLVIKYLLIVVIYFSVIALLMFIPIYLHFDLPKVRYFLQTYIFVLTSPIELFLLTLMLGGMYVTVMYVPLWILPIYISGQVVLISKIMDRRFLQLQIFTKNGQ